MKKQFRTLSAMVALALAISLFATPAYAAIDNDAYIISVTSVQSEWTSTSEMVDYQLDEFTRSWVTWLCDTGYANPTFTQKVERAYWATTAYAKYNQALLDSYVDYNGRRVQVKTIPEEDLAYYVPQYTFSQLLSQVAYYAGSFSGNQPQPLWTCGDFARFMTGLLRAQGIPAYIEVGYNSSTGRYHARVAAIDGNNWSNARYLYYSDPTYGVSTGNTSKWQWLSWSEYSDGYSQSYISAEKMPTKRPGGGTTTTPPAQNPNPPTVAQPNYPSAYAVNIPAKDRWDGIVVPVRKNGSLVGNIPMRAVYFEGAWWLTSRDACAVLASTTRAVNLTWSQNKNTLLFERGEYRWNGSETNWGYGWDGRQVVWTGRFDSILIDKNAQAYMLPSAFFGAEQTNIRVLSIGGVTYVRPVDIARMMNFTGSTAYESELGASFKFQ